MRDGGEQPFRDPSAILPGLEKAFLDFEAVEERLLDAMRIVLRGGDREWRWLHPSCQAVWREYRAEHDEPPVPGPLSTCAMTRAEVERAEEALGWVDASVEAGLSRRIVGVALTQLALGDRARIEWPAVRARLGRDGAGLTTDAIRKRYNRAITEIATRQNSRTSAA
ncbi:hypothetical protein [Rhizorhabdus sp.]|uniref:hypothetical protein n=1 Tax=Rhizorhabdus sp. TaxID=1968843 RepID=UPI0035B4A735